MPFKAAVVLILLALWVPVAVAQGPSLPEGLTEKEPASAQPALPPGLGDEGVSGGKVEEEAKSKKAWHMPAGLKGFWEVRGGLRVKDDPVQDDVSLGETRLQLSYEKGMDQYVPRGRFHVTSDFLYDAVIDDHSVDLEEGEGFLDLRELWVSFTPLESVDVKAGRQILTWGTGNLIFLNDLFPKDYQAFFLGRDLEYLKAPSDALKVSFYSRVVNLDLVYTPRFDADRFIDGSRLSFYDPALGQLRGEDMVVHPDRPETWFEDDEIAVRIHGNIRTFELAAYGYHGFWKGPSGSDRETGEPLFPRLSVLGASIRGPVGPGIGNAELSWYNSEEDEDGDDPLVNNSEFRLLVGYEQEVARDLTMGVQYYLERMLDYGHYKDGLPQGFPPRDENRQWLTLDLTQELMAQNQLVLSLFTFYSLSGGDVYLRPKVTYDFTDHWKLQLGGNIFLGDRETFFGRFEENSNVYGAVRYSY
jgi:hypothetical protein